MQDSQKQSSLILTLVYHILVYFMLYDRFKIDLNPVGFKFFVVPVDVKIVFESRL